MKLRYAAGLGLACLACCAIPLLGVGGFAVGGATVARVLGVPLDLVICFLAPMLLITAFARFLWRRTPPQKCMACPTDRSCGCE